MNIGQLKHLWREEQESNEPNSIHLFPSKFCYYLCWMLFSRGGNQERVCALLFQINFIFYFHMSIEFSQLTFLSLCFRKLILLHIFMHQSHSWPSYIPAVIFCCHGTGFVSSLLFLAIWVFPVVFSFCNQICSITI